MGFGSVGLKEHEVTGKYHSAEDMVQGDTLYRGASDLARLPKNIEGLFLKQGELYPEWSGVKGKPLFRYETLLPHAAILPTANPPAVTSTDGANFSYKTLDFDQATEEACYWVFNLSPDYAKEDFMLIIRWKSTAIAGDAKWGLSVVGREEGEVWDAPLGTEQTVVVAAPDVAGELAYATIPPFPPNCSPNDTVVVKLARKAADGADTLAADACVTEVFLIWATKSIISVITPITPTEIPRYAIADWTEYDASAIIPSGATGVIFQFTQALIGGDQNFGIRKKGSTDDRHDSVFMVNIWGMIGVDENRKLETYGLLTSSDGHCYIIGYTTAGVNFFTNGKDKTPTGYNAWLDMPLKADCPDAKAIIIETSGATTEDSIGLRKKGSSDNLHPHSNRHTWAIVPCDTDQVIQGYIDPWNGSSSQKFYVVGYISEAVSMRTNGVGKPPAVAGEWAEVDCSAEAPGANMIFFEFTADNNWQCGLRRIGDTVERYGYGRHGWAIVKCDDNQKLEVKVGSITVNKINLIGYSVP